MSKIDCLFINPRDLVGADPYVKLANLAGMLDTRNIKSAILDPAASKLSHKQIVQIVRRRQPKIVCIGAFPSTLPDAYQTVQAIKTEFNDKVFVLEGYHINADPGIVTHMGVDYGIRGDAEKTFADLCESILYQKSLDTSLPGLVINTDGKLQVNEPGFVRDINELPIPAYYLLPLGKYYSASTTLKYMKFFTTRGCPYDCNFCASAAQMKYRYLKTENVIKQLDILVNQLGVKWIEFMDLTFTVSRPRTIELCDAIIESGLQFEWGCETRADKIDEELLLKMKAAGCKKITFGVEAGTEKIRYLSGKQISNERMKYVFNLCRQHGIKTMANFIFGHPGETAEDMEQTIKFAREIRPFNVLFTRMIPLPDVEIYQNGVKNGEIDADIWVKYMKGEIDHPVYYPKTVPAKQMDKLFGRAYVKFYFSADVIKEYLPLLVDIPFLLRSTGVFIRIAFGKPLFK